MTLNPNPQIYLTEESNQRDAQDIILESNEEVVDPLDALEVFGFLKDINDPEHPLTLQQLNVVQLQLVNVDLEKERVKVCFTPTIPHCSMATLIGLCIRVKLLRSLHPKYKVDVQVTPGSHASELQVNKQLNDKERVAAALENSTLIKVVNKCLTPSTHL